MSVEPTPTPAERQLVRCVIGEFLHLMLEHAEKMESISTEQKEAAKRVKVEDNPYESQVKYAKAAKAFLKYMFGQLGSNRNVVGPIVALRECLAEITQPDE